MQYQIPADLLGGMEVTTIDWAPGGRFVFSSWDSEVIWITDGTRSHFLSEGKHPKVSPNGKKIAFTVEEDGKTVWTMDLDGSNKQKIHAWNFGSSGAVWSPDSQEIVFADGVGEYENSIKALSLDGVERVILDAAPYGVRYIVWNAPWDLETRVSPPSWGQVKHEHPTAD